MDTWIILRDIVILLAGSLLLGGLLARIGQNPIVGYLIAGMLLGPGSLSLVSSKQEIEAIAELGVALLLFSLGLEFSLVRLKKLGTKPLLGGVVQVLATIVLTTAAGVACGLGMREAIAVGAMVSLSSTAVVLRILAERGEVDTPHGRNSLGVLLTQDMAVVPLALLVTILGGSGNPEAFAWNVGKLLLMAIGLIVALWTMTRVAVVALGKLTLHRNRELASNFAVVAGLAAAWASHSVGISPALGAFVGGMLLGSSAFATQVRADIAPLQVVLLTLFFSSAGMVADPIWILENAHIVVTTLLALTLGKMLIIWAIFRAFGQTSRVAAATGLSLAQIGEFAFVLGSIGRVAGVVSAATYALIVSVAILSFFVSAFSVPMAPKFGNWIASLRPSQDVRSGIDQRMRKHAEVAVIGFGPSGEIAAQPLVGAGIPVVVIDLSHQGARRAKELGFDGHIGDATQTTVLEHAAIRRCRVVLVTVPHQKTALTILELIRKEVPEARIIVRSRYEQHASDFIDAGAHVVEGDEHQVGKCLARHISEWMASRVAKQPVDN